MKGFKKVTLSMCIVLACVVLLAGCSGGEAPIRFYIEDYNLAFMAPQEWERTENYNFDLKITDGKAYFSVMVYYSIDLAADETPKDVYAWQNNDLFSKRENVEVVEEEQIIQYDGGTITATLFSAEREHKKNYYYSCLVQLDDNEDIFMWVLINATPSYILKNQNTYFDMIKTMEYVEE